MINGPAVSAPNPLDLRRVAPNQQVKPLILDFASALPPISTANHTRLVGTIRSEFPSATLPFTVPNNQDPATKMATGTRKVRNETFRPVMVVRSSVLVTRDRMEI
jgi:hypothetical protein